MEFKPIDFVSAEAGSPYLEELESWIDGEWGDATPENRERIREGLLGQVDCPSAIVALQGNRAVGVVSFRRFNVPNGEAEALWVDALFARPSARNNRLGVGLLVQAESVAEAFVPTLYVFTDIPEFYEKFEWKALSRDAKSGNWILCKEL